MSDFDFDLLNELVEDAPTAGYGPQVNFGKCTMGVVIMSWETGDDGKRKANSRPFAKGEQLKQGEYLQINFSINVTELNPMLANEWKRRVDIRKSGPKSKTDWSETVEPSLLKVFGKDWGKKIGKGVYVQVEDAETVERNRDGELRGWNSKPDEEGKTKHYTNTVPRFLAFYKSKAECEIARAERFAKRENGTSPELETSNGIPDEVITNVKGLIASVGVAQAETILSTKPFGEYEVEELMKAANPL